MYKLTFTLAFLLLSINTDYIFSQSLEDCGEPDEYSFPGGATLCSTHSDFSADVTIGTGLSPITYAKNLLSTNFNGDDIKVNGTFIIDKSVSMYNCRVKFGRGAKIIIYQYKYLYGLFTDMFACSDMWEGIIVHGKGTIALLACEIEDAKYAITADDGARLSLHYNTFDRNYVGIRNRTSYENEMASLYLPSGGNEFTCTSELNDDSVGEISLAGIHINRGVARIGNLHLANEFSNMNYGILSEEASTFVTNCTFDDMQSDGSDDGGYCIEGRLGLLTVDGYTIPSSSQVIGQSEFYDCDYAGIYGNGVDLTVKNCKFYDNELAGIYTRNNIEGQRLHIEDNYIDFSFSDAVGGILVERGVGSSTQSKHIIRDDSILLNSNTHAYGIFILEEYPNFDHIQVDSNDIIINTTSAINGISLTGINSGGFKVLSNNVTTPSSNYVDLRYGIFALDIFGLENEISFNNVSSASTNQNLQCGIHIDRAKNFLLCNNNLNLTRRGTHFVGDNTTVHLMEGQTITVPIVLSKTFFNEHKRGLLIQDLGTGDGMIGKQLRTGNVWSTDVNDYEFFGAENDSDPQFSKIIVPPNSPGLIPPSFDPSSGWFFQESGDDNSCVTFSLLEDIQISAGDSVIINDSFTGSSDSAAISWSLNTSLMFKLYQYPELIEESSIEETYFENNEEESVGKYGFAWHKYFQAMIVDSSSRVQADSIREA